MRIISQDGMIDFPYEQTVINIDYNDRTIIRAEGCHCDGDNSMFTVARYSTEVKARKAMEMLRKAYAGLPIIMQNIEITDDVTEMFKEYQKQGIFVQTADNQPSKVEFLNNGYFKFPADDKVKEQDV